MPIKPFDLSEVTYIKRVTVGNPDPTNMKTEETIKLQMEEVNKCLNSSPRGIIIGIDKNFGIYNVGEHQVVLQSISYQIGFKRKPTWITD